MFLLFWCPINKNKLVSFTLPASQLSHRAASKAGEEDKKEKTLQTKVKEDHT